MSVGQRLKEIREALGLNQADFGKPLYLKQHRVSRLERDAKGYYLPEVARDMLVRVYGVNMDFVYNGTPPMFNNPPSQSRGSNKITTEQGELLAQLRSQLEQLEKNLANEKLKSENEKIRADALEHDKTNLIEILKGLSKK